MCSDLYSARLQEEHETEHDFLPHKWQVWTPTRESEKNYCRACLSAFYCSENTQLKEFTGHVHVEASAIGTSSMTSSRLILKGGQHPQLGRLFLRHPAWSLTRRLIPSRVLIERITNTHLGSIHSGSRMVWLLPRTSLCNDHFLSWLTVAATSLSANTNLDICSWKWFDSQWFLSPIKLFWSSSFAHCKHASVSGGRQQIAVPLALSLDLDRVPWDKVIYNWDAAVMCHDAGAQLNAVFQRPSNRAILVKEVRDT